MRLARARETVERYLKRSPPKDQVAQLIDVLQGLVKAAEKVTSEEELIFDEVRAFIENYVGESDDGAAYKVIIAPQNRKQDTAIATLLPDAGKISIVGGVAYIVDSYYSRNFAQVIRDQYRTLGFFTIETDER